MAYKFQTTMDNNALQGSSVEAASFTAGFINPPISI